MVKDINSLGGITPPKADIRQNTKGSAEAISSPATASTETKTATASSDDVQISNSAKTLQGLADKVKDLPEVNIERAEKIKAALERGDYKIDDLVLADKILNSEALLGK